MAVVEAGLIATHHRFASRELFMTRELFVTRGRFRRRFLRGFLADYLGLSLDRFVFNRRGKFMRTTATGRRRTSGFPGFASFTRHLRNSDGPAARVPAHHQAVDAAQVRRAGTIFGRRGPVTVASAPLLAFWFDDRDLPSRDFAQSGDDFLVVRFDQGAGALEQLFGPACRCQHQFEPVRDLFQAILYSYSSHRRLIFRLGAAIVNATARAPDGDKAAKGLSRCSHWGGRDGKIGAP